MILLPVVVFAEVVPLLAPDTEFVFVMSPEACRVEDYGVAGLLVNPYVFVPQIPVDETRGDGTTRSLERS